MLQGRHVVLVLGIARSGTSAVSGVLARLGVDFGTGLKPADHRNPKGFYEDFEASRLNQRVLTALGRTWCDPRPLPIGWAESALARKAAAQLETHIASSFPSGPVIGLKDPRMVRLLPLYLQVAASLGRTPWIVVVRRPPAQVIESIRLSGYFHGAFSHKAVRTLYDIYETEIEHHAAGQRVTKVDYPDLLRDPSGVARRLAGFFEFPAHPLPVDARGIGAFVDSALCHHGYGPQVPVAAASPLRRPLTLATGLLRRTMAPLARAAGA